MYSTYPNIAKFTPNILRAVCLQKAMTEDEYRLGTLKRVECEIGNLLENALHLLHEDDRAALEDLHRQVRCAIGDE